MIQFLLTYGRLTRRILLVVGIVILLALFVFMPLSWVQSTIRFATVYTLGALAALIASRAGVLNLAIEGKMLIGSYIAVAVLYKTGLDPVVGVMAATLAGGALGFIFAILYLRIKINLIILALA